MHFEGMIIQEKFCNHVRYDAHKLLFSSRQSELVRFGC